MAANVAPSEAKSAPNAAAVFTEFPNCLGTSSIQFTVIDYTGRTGSRLPLPFSSETRPGQHKKRHTI